MSKNNCACTKARTKRRDDKELQLLKNRLSRIEGQIRGIKSMVEGGAYCPDILIQVSAVNSALTAFSKALLTNHINTCVKTDILENREGAAEELAELLERLMK